MVKKMYQNGQVDETKKVELWLAGFEIDSPHWTMVKYSCTWSVAIVDNPTGIKSISMLRLRS